MSKNTLKAEVTIKSALFPYDLISFFLVQEPQKKKKRGIEYKTKQKNIFISWEMAMNKTYVELILNTYHECVRLEKAGEYALYLFESLVLAITLFKKNSVLEKHNQILCKLCCFVASIPILFGFFP